MSSPNSAEPTAKPAAAKSAKPTSPTASTAPKNPQRRKILLTLTAVVVVAGLVFGGYEWIVGGRSESTDNAYVQGNIIQITPQTGGTVQAILADETDFVRAGEAVVKLDPADAQATLQTARANLAQAVRQTRTLYANNGSLQAQIALREADVAGARAALQRARSDRSRRQALTGQGAVSREELQHTQTQEQAAASQLASAEAALAVARENLLSNQALTDQVDVAQHPAVMAAAAKVREAHLALQRTTLLAPLDGYIGKRTVQLGQRLAAGAPVMTLIPLRGVWVEANLKENQLRHVRLGQAVELTADLYGKDVRYRGTVAGLGVGTGAAFALLPAQNASGNWIKVVQRVPVRIALDEAQLLEHPLRVGLSMYVTINVQDRSGAVLPTAPRADALAQTDVNASRDAAIAADIAAIIQANLGQGAASAPAALAQAGGQNPAPVVRP